MVPFELFNQQYQQPAGRVWDKRRGGISLRSGSDVLWLGAVPKKDWKAQVQNQNTSALMQEVARLGTVETTQKKA